MKSRTSFYVEEEAAAEKYNFFLVTTNKNYVLSYLFIDFFTCFSYFFNNAYLRNIYCMICQSFGR